jgi:hypothetical protein
MKMSKLAIFGILFALLSFSAARAQQVITKGSWVLSAPSDNGPIVLGVYSSVAFCQQGWRDHDAAVHDYYNAALSNQKKYYEDPYQAAMAAAPGDRQAVMAGAAAKDGVLANYMNAATEMLNSMQDATCIQQ